MWTIIFTSSLLPVLSGAANFYYGGFGNFSRSSSLNPSSELLIGDQFGREVAIWKTTCIVAATKRTYVNQLPDDEGLVYVFTQNSDMEWTDAGITMSSKRSDDSFGNSLSLYEGTAAIGAPTDSTYGTSAGCVHVFYSTNTLFGTTEQIYAPSPQQGDFFGYSVATVSGNTYYYDGAIVVGAYGHDYVYGAHEEKKITDVGCVFVFANEEGSWELVTTMQPSESIESGYFGWSVHGSSGAIAVGAPGSGAAYLFHLEPVMYDCPHEGPHEEMPEACLDEHGNPVHRRLDARRHLQGAPPGKHMYSVWEYIEALHVQDDTDLYSGNGFGQQVAVCNVSSPSLVVSAPTEEIGLSSGSSRYGTTGAVFVFTLCPTDDLTSGFSVPNYDDHHEDHPHRRVLGAAKDPSSDSNLRDNAESSKIVGDIDREEFHFGKVKVIARRRLQGGPPGEDRPGHHNVWNFRKNDYTTDKDGYVWAQSVQISGLDSSYQYGYKTAIFQEHLVVGVLGGKSVQGRADIFGFNRSAPTGLAADSSLMVQQKSLPVSSGNLYGKSWYRLGTIKDKQGGDGDMFGSATSIYKDFIVIGGPLTGMTDQYSIGKGAAYVFDPYREMVSKKKRNNKDNQGTSSAESDSFEETSMKHLSLFLNELVSLLKRHYVILILIILLGVSVTIISKKTIKGIYTFLGRYCQSCLDEEDTASRGKLPYASVMDDSVSTVNSTTPMTKQRERPRVMSQPRRSVESYYEDEYYDEGSSYDNEYVEEDFIEESTSSRYSRPSRGRSAAPSGRLPADSTHSSSSRGSGGSRSAGGKDKRNRTRDRYSSNASSRGASYGGSRG